MLHESVFLRLILRTTAVCERIKLQCRNARGLKACAKLIEKQCAHCVLSENVLFTTNLKFLKNLISQSIWRNFLKERGNCLLQVHDEGQQKQRIKVTFVTFQSKKVLLSQLSERILIEYVSLRSFLGRGCYISRVNNACDRWLKIVS